MLSVRKTHGMIFSIAVLSLAACSGSDGDTGPAGVS
jgi:hypothetical protein